MALYQPTNIIPSSYTKGTVDAVNDKMEISWQVNGNSAMTAFQIDFYLNDANSTPVTSTGRLTDNCPFYGTDRFGRPEFFTWSPNANPTWNGWSNKLTNGNEYKYKITQWYSSGSDEYILVTQESIIPDNLCYFSLVNSQGVTIYVNFLPTTTFLPPGKTIKYNLTTKEGYIILDNGTKISFIGNESPTPVGINLGVATNVVALQQNTFNVFTTRKTPSLTIYRSNEKYSNEIDFPNNGSIATSIGFFKAVYEQEQNDPIRWIRWQVATASKNNDNTYNLGEIIADTGDIYTPTLNYEFNGFFNGQQYAIRCFGESESGQDCDSGWVYFNIKIENQGEYLGDLTVQCLNKENATLLEWGGVEVIPPTTSPQGYKPTISNGSVTLLPKNGDTEYSVTWDSSGANPMNFSAPWTAVLKGRLTYTANTYIAQISGETETIEVVNGKQVWVYSQTLTLDIAIITGVRILGTYKVADYSVSISRMADGMAKVTVKLYGLYAGNPTVVATLAFDYGNIASPAGKIFSILSGNTEMLSLSITQNQLIVTVGGVANNISVVDWSVAFALSVSSLNISIFFYKNGGLIGKTALPITYTQQPMTSVSIYGGDSGATVDSVSVYQGDGSNILSLYENPDFEPAWNSPNYKLYMTANFNGNLEGGTGTTTGSGFRVYRQEVGKNVLTPIATVPSTTTSIKDYGIVSRKAYKYSLCAYDNNGAFMSAVENEKVIATCFKNYSLIVCDYDETNDEYHVRKQYLFALNLSTGSVGNNNSPTLNANFTRYPTRMPSTQNYASGTLQGLIGAIYTVPALIEQIGNYKWTAKPSTLDYFDSVDLEQELYDLSTAPYQLFLRDMKGRLRMIATNGAVTMTTNIKQKQQSISISFPWVEIGDASDVTIIQTPEDYGWNNDNQVLDVSLDVDVDTGELSATYPFPYNGTKFYLTGVNKETLTAKTPLGVTPAQFDLSEVAEEPNDGELTATVKLNSEDN